MTDITPETIEYTDFQSYFRRDFSFLPVWVEGNIYNTGNVVYYDGKFYSSLVDDNEHIPTETDYWKYTDGNINDYVGEDDFKKAQGEAMGYYPAQLIPDNQAAILSMHVIAFWLAYDLRNSAGGGNTGAGFLTSKSVDGVSASYQIPDWLTKNLTLSILASNSYGLKYATWLYPYIRFNSFVVKGKTTND